MDAHTKVVVGRNASENESLKARYLEAESHASALLVPKNFAGPTVLLVGPPTDGALLFAGGLLLRYTKQYDPENALVERDLAGTVETVPICVQREVAELATL